jgi:hypothetical protein
MSAGSGSTRPGSTGNGSRSMAMRWLAGSFLVLGAAIGFHALGSWLGAASIVDGASTDPRAQRVREALDEPDAIVRYRALASSLLDLSHEDLEAVVDVYEERLELLPPGEGEMDLLGEAWAAIDAESAIDRMQAWPDASRKIGIAAVVRAWALRTPIAAFTWADSLDAETRTAALESVFRGWAASGDSDVWRLLATLPAGWDRETATSIVMQRVARTEGFDALLERVAAIEPGDRPGHPRDFKLGALRTAVGLCAYYEPEKALAFARGFAGGPYDNNLLRRVAVFWAAKDGPTAMDALVDLPGEPERDRALRDAYRKWLRSEGQAALDWMPSDAADDDRFAPLLDLYVIALSRKKTGDPIEAVRTAARWADQIPDLEARRKAAGRIGIEWLQHEPDAARAWIEARGLGREIEAARRQRTAVAPRGKSSGAPKPDAPSTQ